MLEKLNCYVRVFGILSITVALIVVMGGCLFSPSSQNLEIQAGYDELASPTANEGEGWQPIIGTGGDPPFTGTFDGQGYEIRDLYINLPGKGYVGLFSIVGEGGVIQNIGVVNANITSNAYIGGLVGANSGTVSNSYSTGSMTGVLWVGGLMGFNVEEGAVSNSYSTCSVTSDYGAGGLMGGNVGTVSNSYSTGSVTSDEGVGGLMGANSGTVSNSYSTGSVTGNDDVGGLVGYSEGTASDSFWDTETSGQATSAGGTGKTTAEMQDIITFSGAAWDVIAVANPGMRNPEYTWNIVDDQTYPFLSWQS
jgi:hypothetical protein